MQWVDFRLRSLPFQHFGPWHHGRGPFRARRRLCARDRAHARRRRRPAKPATCSITPTSWVLLPDRGGGRDGRRRPGRRRHYQRLERLLPSSRPRPSLASISIASAAAGNVTVAHLLGRAPLCAIIQMTSGGAIWFQTPTSYDGMKHLFCGLRRGSYREGDRMVRKAYFTAQAAKSQRQAPGSRRRDRRGSPCRGSA